MSRHEPRLRVGHQEADMTNVIRRITVLAGVALLLVTVATPAFAQFFRTDSVLAYDTDTWRVWAFRGQTRVVVNGDGDTDLDCWVYDRFGTLLGSDTDATDLCIIQFHNPTSGDLTIRIRNLGDVYNRYELTVD
jgi:hypothetical protein